MKYGRNTKKIINYGLLMAPEANWNYYFIKGKYFPKQLQNTHKKLVGNRGVKFFIIYK